MSNAMNTHRHPRADRIALLVLPRRHDAEPAATPGVPVEARAGEGR
jgi:hypothetical protein